jgi:EpsI family protein
MMKNFRFVLTILILLVAAGVNYLFSKPDVSLPRKSLSEFPKILGDWTIVGEQQIDDKTMKILQVDDYIVRNYRNSRGEIVGLYVGYWKSQREGKGIHSPRQCLPGSGWVPIDISVYKVSVKDHNPNSVPVNKFVMGKGLDRHLYLFWYQGRNRIYASEYWNRIYLIWDAITQKRTDGALLRLDNVVTRSPDDSLKTQVEFIQLISPILKEYIAD